MVHSGASAFMLGFVLMLVAALLAGCGDPYEDWAMRPAGYVGDVQYLEEASTGCLYSVNTKVSEEARPMLRPDGSQMGCRATTPAETGAVGTDERSEGVNQ
jgi:hypothetical protein